MSAFDPKRTSLVALQMSAFEDKADMAFAIPDVRFRGRAHLADKLHVRSMASIAIEKLPCLRSEIPCYAKNSRAIVFLLHQVSRHHGVNALVAVDQLRDTQVAGEAAEHVGLLRTPARYLDQPADHIAQCLLGGVV